MDVKLSEEEREEVHEGLMLRVEQTKKAKKTNEEAGLRMGAREAEQRLRLLRGQDGEPGLLSKFVDQTELHMPPGNGEGAADDLFDGADRSTTPKGPAGAKPRKSRSKASAAVETVNEADRTAESTSTGEPEPEYEIIEENPPPPRADQVTSLVPHE